MARSSRSDLLCIWRVTGTAGHFTPVEYMDAYITSAFYAENNNVTDRVGDSIYPNVDNNNTNDTTTNTGNLDPSRGNVTISTQRYRHGSTYMVMYQQRNSPRDGGCRWEDASSTSQCSLWGWTVFKLQPTADTIVGAKRVAAGWLCVCVCRPGGGCTRACVVCVCVCVCVCVRVCA